MTAPTTSGTYAFAPPLSDLIIAAYGRIQIRRPALTVEHLQDAAMASNLLQVEWAAKEVNLWTVDLQSIPLLTGVSTYDVDPATVMIMATYVQSTVGGVPTDRIIISVDRDTYASFPDKTTEGTPTVYWFNLQRAPTITIWQPPDSDDWTLKFYRARQVQDASIPNGLHPEVPYRFLEAYTAGLAAKLSLTWATDRTAELTTLAKTAFKDAADRDVENAPLRIIPAMSTYTDGVYN